MNNDNNFKKYEPMFYSILKKYGLYNKREDYIDICYIGYAKALKKYDSSKSKPATYIYKCIENELLQCLRKENAIKRQRQEYSMDYIYDDKGHSLNDIVANDVDLERDIIKEETNNKLYNSIKNLTKREQYIIKSFFGLNCEAKTQFEIGERLGITQTQVSRLKDKILIKMRGMIENER